MARPAGNLSSRLRSARVVATIAFRNLVRQFRRNLLLGLGIAVGMCVLVLTSSFTAGLTDILFNKVLVLMTGHIQLVRYEYTSRRSDVIRDKERFIEAVKRNVEGVTEIDETISAFGRGIGNGRTGMLALVGLRRDADFYDQTQLEAGNPRDIFRPDTFPGILLYKNAARDLNVGLNDILTIRFETIYGQSQAAKFKVVGIIPSENMFMDTAAFVDMETLRGLLNLKPEECLGLNILTAYPQNQARIIAQANRLHAALTPGAAGLRATIRVRAMEQAVELFALKLENDPAALEAARRGLRFVEGDLESLRLAEEGILLSAPLARRLGAGLGTPLEFTYLPSFDPRPVTRRAVVKGLIEVPEAFTEATAFAHEELFYQTYFRNLPREPAAAPAGAALSKALLPEWELLERSGDTKAAMKKQLRLGREPWKGARVDVQTMFETASMVVDFQRGLNTVSIVAVLILFFVILIGVVNTMRMSIRERTREIGTNRAIGMQRSDVRAVFVLEIVFLAAAACLLGVLLAYGLMALLSSFTVELRDNPFSMFFVNKHLYFVPKAWTIVGNFLTIVLVALVIAFFTARRAARLRVADALRHFE